MYKQYKNEDKKMKEMTIKIILTDDAGDSTPTGILKDVLDNDCVWNATLDKSQHISINKPRLAEIAELKIFNILSMLEIETNDKVDSVDVKITPYVETENRHLRDVKINFR